MPIFAEVFNGTVSAIFESNTAPRLPDPPYKVVDVTEYNPRPQSGWPYNDADSTFTDPATTDPRPLVRVKCIVPDTDPEEISATFFRITDADIDALTSLPKANRTNRWRQFSGIAVPGEQNPQSLLNAVNYGPHTIAVSHPRGGIVLTRYRLNADGGLEMEMPGGWQGTIPFWSRESGIVNVTDAFSAYFRVVDMRGDPLILNILLG